jgi:Glyoxalase/Bleomycin resistance protein/Dioxygenase superfamily
MTKENIDSMSIRTEISSWLHVMPHLPVSGMERSISYYQEALGFEVAWRIVDGSLTALASGGIEILLLTPQVAGGCRRERILPNAVGGALEIVLSPADAIVSVSRSSVQASRLITPSALRT